MHTTTARNDYSSVALQNVFFHFFDPCLSGFTRDEQGTVNPQSHLAFCLGFRNYDDVRFVVFSVPEDFKAKISIATGFKDYIPGLH